MSQEKVDAYKREKAGRRQRLLQEKKRKKRIRVIVLLAAVVLVLAVVFASLAGQRAGSSDSGTDEASSLISTVLPSDAAGTEGSTEE